MVVAATNTRPEHPIFETAVDTISDLLKVRRVRITQELVGTDNTSHRGSRGNIHAIILIVDWWSYREFFSSYVKKMKSQPA